MYSQQQLITALNPRYIRETEELPKCMVVLDFREGAIACLGWLVQKNA